MMFLLALLACNDEVDEWACIGPLVELVKWRDAADRARMFGTPEALTDAALAAEESRRVALAVEALRPKRAACELTWSLQLFQEADNPALRLRERAIQELMGVPTR